MSLYHATVSWLRNNEAFIDNKYSRAHQWEFQGDTKVAASASSHIVPIPYSVPENVDPEEAFVASLSSCHMLFFLSIAAKKKLVVDLYRDTAEGVLEKNKNNKMAMTKVVLNPEIKFSGKQPSAELIDKIHHLAHQECFIANSVKTKIEIIQS